MGKPYASHVPDKEDKNTVFQFCTDENKEPICPDCAGTKWLGGPEGGGSINIKCANTACGSEFNYMIMLGAHRI